MNVDALCRFIFERHSIYQKRAAGQPQPWTTDLILSEYRFCNVYRELDAVTQWVAREWREPHQGETYLWFAITVARFLNRPTTLEAAGFPIPWQPAEYGTVLEELRKNGPIFNSAYIISTAGQEIGKVDYMIKLVLNPLWANRDALRRQQGELLSSWHARLAGNYGLGSFLAAQVVADMKYVESWKDAPDWWDFASSGPGSRRGLNRVLGKQWDAAWSEAEWYAALMEVMPSVQSFIASNQFPTLHAQDLQNCLCEFDKYERTRTGQGRPKRHFAPQQKQQPALL